MGQRQKNLCTAAVLAESCGWQSIQPAEPFRTGILLLQREAHQSLPASQMREAFADRGIALTSYAGGMVRLSMPGEEWQADDMHRLGTALRFVA